MKAIVLFALLLVNFNKIEGGSVSNCDIQGVDRYDWIGNFYPKTSIGDSHRGLIATYKTTNIVALTKQTSTYMNATFSNEILSIFTNERFELFEEEYEGSFWSPPTISISMTFNCSDNKSETLGMQQKVTDDNTHDPIFDKDVYEYHFGMPLPEDYDLTNFLSISASDKDFSNRYMYFTIDHSEDLRVLYEGQEDYDNYKNYFTYIKTLKEIKAPFRQEFTLVARDAGEPSRNSTARILISVTSNAENEIDESNESTEGNGGNETFSHPPVFAKHLYFANYTSQHNLKMEETITIKYGAESDTIIKQSSYDEYFRITLDPTIKGLVQVAALQSLPQTIIESTTFLVIEIEAVNKDLHMPGRTALIIHLPSTSKGMPEGNSGNCSVTHILGSSGNSTFAVVFFLTALSLIVAMNVIVLVWYFQKRKVISNVVPMSYPVSQVSNPEKMYKI